MGSVNSQARSHKQVGTLKVPPVGAKKQDMDSLSLGKSGGYVLSDLFKTLAQVLSHRYQEQKGCLSLN